MMSLKSRAGLLRERERKIIRCREMMMLIVVVVIVERRRKGKGDLKQGIG